MFMKFAFLRMNKLFYEISFDLSSLNEWHFYYNFLRLYHFYLILYDYIIHLIIAFLLEHKSNKNKNVLFTIVDRIL